MLLTSLFICLGAMILSAAATPIARRVAWRTGITDAPSARKVHTEPKPLLGGAAIYVAVMLALAIFGGRRDMLELAGILGAASLVSFLGLWDDRRPLRPMLKLGGQLLCAAMVVAAGVRVSLTGILILDVAISVVWLVTITNALNFMDNMDGVSGGVSAIAAGSFLILALMNDQHLVAPLAAAVLGACVGFLVYNFNPASIFMGDGGSLFLGFVLAAIGIKLRFHGVTPTVSWMIPITVLAVPLFDLVLVMVSRIRRRVNPFTTGGQDHLAHRLVRHGATHRQAALTIYELVVASGVLAFVIGRSTREQAVVLSAVAVLLGLAALWHLELSPQAAKARAGAVADPVAGGSR